MDLEVQHLLGKAVTSTEGRDAIKKYGLSKVKNSPPNGKYYQSHSKGIEVFALDDLVASINYFVQPDKPYKAYSGTLPGGLKAGMSQDAVHKLIGKPDEA